MKFYGIVIALFLLVAVANAGWWNNSWFSKKEGTVSDVQGITRNNDLVSVNVTGLTLQSNNCSEVRVVASYNTSDGRDVELPREIMNDSGKALGDGSDWCLINYNLNASTVQNSTHVISNVSYNLWYYFNNSGGSEGGISKDLNTGWTDETNMVGAPASTNLWARFVGGTYSEAIITTENNSVLDVNQSAAGSYIFWRKSSLAAKTLEVRLRAGTNQPISTNAIYWDLANGTYCASGRLNTTGFIFDVNCDATKDSTYYLPLADVNTTMHTYRFVLNGDGARMLVYVDWVLKWVGNTGVSGGLNRIDWGGDPHTTSTGESYWDYVAYSTSSLTPLISTIGITQSQTNGTLTLNSPVHLAAYPANVTVNFSILDYRINPITCWIALNGSVVNVSTFQNNSNSINYVTGTNGLNVLNVTCLSGYGNNLTTGAFFTVQNNVTIQVFDEETLAQLYFNVSFNNGSTTTFTNQFYFNQTVESIPAATTFLTLDNYSGGYYQRTIYKTFSTNSTNLTYYLLKTASASVVRIHVQSLGLVPISSARVSAWKSISGNYALLQQSLTDSSGTATLYLSPLTTYVIEVTATGYTSQNNSINPTGTDYTITLSSGTTSLPEFIFNDTTYSLTPSVLSMNKSLTPVWFTVTSNASLTLYGLNVSYGGTWIFNQTKTDASGGSINITLNNTARSGNLTIVLFIKKTGLNLWTQNYTYRIYNISSTEEYTSADALRNLADSLGSTQDFAAPLVLLIVVGFTSAWMARFSIIGGGLLALILLGAAMAINPAWFPPWAWFVMAIGLFALAIIRFRES